MTRIDRATSEDGRFLSGYRLSAAIRHVAGGAEVRCAVAFWGKGASDLARNAPLTATARIICDVTLGGTNPKALVELGAPTNPDLRCVDGLHAKIYLSDRGMVVGSANASGGGVGFGKRARLVEAGVQHSATSLAYTAAERWFERQWRISRQVDDDALELARSRWAPAQAGRPALPGTPANPNSVLDTIAADPERFRGVGFVLTSGSSTTKQRDAASSALLAKDKAQPQPLLSAAERRAIKLWRVGNLFSDWDPAEVHAWPELFICAHRDGRGRFTYWFYERAHTVLLEGDCGMVLARRPGNLRRKLGFKRAAVEMAQVDAPRLKRLIEHDGHHQLFETPEKLIAGLNDLGLS